MRSTSALMALPLLVIVLIGGAMSQDGSSAQATNSPLAGQVLDPAALPAAARTILPILDADLAATCPDLPVLWVAAEIQAESGWNPHAYSSAGAAGLLQLEPATWTSAGGRAGWDPAHPPAADHPVWDPARHLAVAIPWMCTNLHAMTTHLTGSGKQVTALDAMAVCHVAGCSRVTDSATGIPSAGEAGCATSCANAIHDYLTAIHTWIGKYADPTVTPGATNGGSEAAAQPFTGISTGCTLPDPTGTGGCVTPATAWMLTQVQATFGHQAATCWDAHAWNTTSDHPKGKACDLTIGTAGTYPDASAVAHGWAIADWLQTNATGLDISYLIWQGHIWSPSRAAQGWRVYDGGGIYDVDTPTGGHYDHIHVSVTT